MIGDISSRTLEKLTFYVDDVVFPCTKSELLRYAEHNYAPEPLLNAIEDLPRASSYSNIKEVISEIKVSSKQSSSHFV